MTWSNEQARTHYANNESMREAARKRAREQAERIRNDPVLREKAKEYRKEYKRKQRRAAGIQPIIAKQLWPSNARQAWTHWMQHAPDWWLDSYWANHSHPWKDKRLSEAEKYTTRYEHDPVFRDKERERVRMYKYSHPETVAGWDDARPGNRRRWNQAAIRADGTVTKRFMRRITTEKWCAYCGDVLDVNSREVDHVTPLSQGGIHSASNLVASCFHCNRSKGRKKLWQFLPSLCL